MKEIWNRTKKISLDKNRLLEGDNKKLDFFIYSRNVTFSSRSIFHYSQNINTRVNFISCFHIFFKIFFPIFLMKQTMSSVTKNTSTAYELLIQHDDFITDALLDNCLILIKTKKVNPNYANFLTNGHREAINGLPRKYRGRGQHAPR